MKRLNNIERLNSRWVGYVNSSGRAIKIYGDSKTGYCANGKCERTLQAISEYLKTI